MRIPWIQEWNEHRRLRHEERKQERMVRRLADGYENFSKGFAKSFGVPFELAAVMAIQPRMKELVRDALPDILNALAEGNPGVDGGEYDGTLVASLDRQHGAFWGEAPAGEGVDYEDTYGFAAKILSWDAQTDTYQIFYRDGSAQVAGGSTKYFDASTISLQNSKCFWLAHFKSNDMWTIMQGDRFPTENIVLPDENDNGGGAGTSDLIVPLWKFTYVADGGGYVSQYVSGSVFIARTLNVLDVDSWGDEDDSGGE